MKTRFINTDATKEEKTAMRMEAMRRLDGHKKGLSLLLTEYGAWDVINNLRTKLDPEKGTFTIILLKSILQREDIVFHLTPTMRLKKIEYYLDAHMLIILTITKQPWAQQLFEHLKENIKNKLTAN